MVPASPSSSASHDQTPAISRDFAHPFPLLYPFARLSPDDRTHRHLDDPIFPSSPRTILAIPAYSRECLYLRRPIQVRHRSPVSPSNDGYSPTIAAIAPVGASSRDSLLPDERDGAIASSSPGNCYLFGIYHSFLMVRMSVTTQ